MKPFDPVRCLEDLQQYQQAYSGKHYVPTAEKSKLYALLSGCIRSLPVEWNTESKHLLDTMLSPPMEDLVETLSNDIRDQRGMSENVRLLRSMREIARKLQARPVHTPSH